MACHFSNTGGACYGQEADKNRMARYVHNVFLVINLQFQHVIGRL